MAKHVYNDSGAKEALRELNKTGWKVSDYDTKIRKRMNLTKFSENGLQSQIYERTKNGKTEYAYAFAGTNSLEDVVEDLGQLIGAAPQYAAAIENARTLSKELDSSELTFVGHSLGGGEAAAASMATGRKAITFNRAAVSSLTKYFNNIHESGNIVNYQTVGGNYSNTRLRGGGDPVTNLQNNFGIGAEGRNIPIYVGKRWSHSIDVFLKHKLPSAK